MIDRSKRSTTTSSFHRATSLTMCAISHCGQQWEIGSPEKVARAMPNQGEYLIHVQGISKTYKTATESVEAVRDVSFQVRRGEFVAVLGPSGCGKSTLMLIIAGLLESSGGKVLVAGKEVAAPQTVAGQRPPPGGTTPPQSKRLRSPGVPTAGIDGTGWF